MYHEYLYIEKLGKTINEEEKVYAINELGKMKSIKAKDALIKFAIDSEASRAIRTKSILALTEIGDKDFLEKLRPFSSIDDDDITELLAYAVKKLNAVEFIDEFKSFINSENVELKKDILDALNAIHSEESIKLMIRFYNSKNKIVKNIIKLYLKDSNQFHKYIENMKDSELLNILGLIPMEKAEVALSKLIDEVNDNKIIKIIISSISDLNLKDFKKIIEKLYRKLDSKELKLQLIENLEDLQGESKKQFLLDLLDSEDRDIRAKALSALYNLSNDEEVMEKVKMMVFVPDEWWLIKKFAVIILAKSEGESYLRELTALLRMEEDERVLRTIIIELGNIGNKETQQDLLEFLNHSKLEIKKVAIEALAKLGYEEILDSVLKEAALIKDVKAETLRILVNFDDEKVASIVEEVIRERRENDELIEIAVLSMKKFDISFAAVQDLILDQSVKREIRAKSVIHLEKFPEESIGEIIVKILKDENEWWMLRKMLLILAADLKVYSCLDIILQYCNNLDERLSKTARETAKSFYKSLLLEKLDGDEKAIANKYMEII